MRAARERLAQLLQSLESDGIVAAGMIGDPDPYTAARNALEYFHMSEIVISTLPSNRSAWIEKGLVEKLERDSGKPVMHVESSAEARRGQRLMEAASITPAQTSASTTSTVTGRPRRTAPRASSPSCSGCCFSSSPR